MQRGREERETERGRVEKVLREMCCLSERVDVVPNGPLQFLSRSPFAGTHACSHLETCPDTALF